MVAECFLLLIASYISRQLRQSDGGNPAVIRSLNLYRPTSADKIMSRDFDHQVTKLQMRAALLNCFTQQGTPDWTEALCGRWLWGT